MIFIQNDNFWTTFFHIHIIFLLFLSSFFSLLHLINKKNEKKDWHKSYLQIIIQISFLNKICGDFYFQIFIRFSYPTLNLSCIFFFFFDKLSHASLYNSKSFKQKKTQNNLQLNHNLLQQQHKLTITISTI